MEATRDPAAALRIIESATCPADLFGADPKVAFRRLGKLCHPDIAGENDRAAAAFSKLKDLYDMATAGPGGPSDIGWDVQGALAKGSICDLYVASSNGHKAALKIARSEANDDLMRREADALERLNASDGTAFKKYIPPFHEGFATTYGRANALGYAEDCRSLQSITGQFPEGVPFRHIVWMGNRLFSALGYAHSQGVIHGAILPHHLLYRPADHGLQIVDWTASVKFPDPVGKIPYRVVRYASAYPAEVAAGDCFPSTDIYMAAQSLAHAAEDIPADFRALFEWCSAESPRARPQDAWALQDKWIEAAKRVYGKPSFVPLNLPIN